MTKNEVIEILGDFQTDKPILEMIDGNIDGYILSKTIAELDKRIAECLKIIPGIKDETLNHGYLKSVEAYQQAKLIVEQNLKEFPETDFKYWWIYCSDKMPPQPKNNLLFENKPLELYLVVLNKTEYPFRAAWNGKFFTDGFEKLENVIAWMPLPKLPKSNKQKKERNDD